MTELNAAPLTLEKIWEEFKSYDGTGSKNFDLSGNRVQFYKGAMEIPLIAIYPSAPFNLAEEHLKSFSRLLSSYGLELDCVEEERNYKINTKEDSQYIGRITTDTLRLHAARIKDMGYETFSKIVSFHLS